MPGESELSCKRSSGQAQLALKATSTVLFGLYRTYLERPVALIIPEHTRDAAFQLLCDLRANTPKDRRFLARHARALAPRTTAGWLAMSSALGFSMCGLISLASIALVLSMAGVWALLGIAIASGLFLAGIMSVLLLGLLGTALVAGTAASCALMMYVCVATTFAGLRLAGRLLMGSPRTATSASNDSLLQPEGSATAIPGLPPIKTKSPNKSARGSQSAGPGSPRPTTTSAAPNAPAPQKVHPAAAAAAILSEPQTPTVGSPPQHAPVTAPASMPIRPSPFNSTGSVGASRSIRGASPLSKAGPGSDNGGSAEVKGAASSGSDASPPASFNLSVTGLSEPGLPPLHDIAAAI